MRHETRAVPEEHAQSRVGIGPTRRQVLRWGLVGGALVAIPITLPGCGDDDPTLRGVIPTPTPIPSFFTASERALVSALVGHLIPNDDTPGGIEAGADEYIDRMLSIVPDEDDAGQVFGGGPFSGRAPFALEDGTPSDRFPENKFSDFIPLTRLQLISWKVRVLGTAAVPGSDFNGPLIGWRQQYRDGLAALQAKSQELFASNFELLDGQQRAQVVRAADSTFMSLLTEHTLEGMFCAPEYGGNRDRLGWRLIGYDGDSQPLGYALFDETTMSYRERADKPCSTADPGDSFAGVDAATRELLVFVVRTARPSFSM